MGGSPNRATRAMPVTVADLPADARVPDASGHTPRQERWRLLILAAAMLGLLSLYQVLATTTYRGSADLHATIEIVGSVLGLVAGFVLVVLFYTLGNRFHLLVGLAFFVNGAEDLVHGLLAFESVHGLTGMPTAGLEQFIPGTYVTGRMLMGILLILAPMRVFWRRQSPDPKRETYWVSGAALVLTATTTVIAFRIPLPQFIYPERLISRPVDFLSAMVLLVALLGILRAYHRDREMLVWWIALSIGINVVGQVLMSFSNALFDPFFDVAHVCKVLGYAAPMLGFSLYQIAVIRERQLAQDSLASERERLAVTLRSIGDGVIAADTNGKVVLVNKAAEELTGWAQEEAIGQPMAEVFFHYHTINGDTRQRCDNPVEKILTSGHVVGPASDTVLVARDGTERIVADSGAPICRSDGHIIGVVMAFRDMTEHRRANEQIARQNRLLGAINRVIHESIRCENDFEVARTCLKVSEDLTGSRFGFIGEINSQGRFDTIALSNPGWDVCQMPESDAVLLINDMEIRGIWGRALKDEQPLIVNDPASCPDRVGTPEGHPPLTCFLGVPLKKAGQTVGMIALANKESGYTTSDMEDIEALSAPFVEALERKRTEQELAQHREHLAELVEERTANLTATIESLEQEMTERERAEEALRESERQLSFRNRIADIFLTVQDDEMYGEVLPVLLDAMQSAYGVFGYIDEDGASVVPSMTRHIWDKCQVDQKTFTFPRETWGDGTWPTAIREKRTISLNEPSTNTPEGHIAIRRHISLPIIHRDEVIGLIQVANKQTDYSEEDVQLLEALGQAIAPVLFARLQRDRHETRRRRAEDEVRRTVVELARSNAELEQFAYVASHDLQEPLRKVQAFGSRLEAKCADGLGDQGRDYLSRMCSAAGRMGTLVNDLLAFSRVTTHGQPFASVDLKNVVRQVLSDLEVRISELNGRVELGELPEIQADPTQMRQLFQNLIGNALKFHKDGVPPLVKIQSRMSGASPRDGQMCRITVQDNGIGFDEKHLKRIFEVFQRLHGRGEYEGTGIGLAVCRKIAERHGGQITAKSTPGQGAGFVVTLPVTHSHERRPK